MFTHYCLLTGVYSPVFTHYCLLTTVYTPVFTHQCLLTTVYSLLFTHQCLLTTVYSPVFTHQCLLTTVLPTSVYSPVLTHQCLLTSLYSLVQLFSSVGAVAGPSPSDVAKGGVFLVFVCRPDCGQNKTFKLSRDRFWRFTRIILCCGECGDTSWSTLGFDLALNCLHRGATWIINSWFHAANTPPHTHALSLFFGVSQTKLLCHIIIIIIHDFEGSLHFGAPACFTGISELGFRLKRRVFKYALWICKSSQKYEEIWVFFSIGGKSFCKGSSYRKPLNSSPVPFIFSYLFISSLLLPELFLEPTLRFTQMGYLKLTSRSNDMQWGTKYSANVE